MIPIASSETEPLARQLASYHLRFTVAMTAGLLTVPHLHANNVRLEVLAHLAVAHCSGQRKPGSKQLRRWLNHHLGDTMIARSEDPVEDVFVTNVETPEGNRRIFEGIWESNDYFSQVLIDILVNEGDPGQSNDLLKPIFALLTLSDVVAERLGLPRWCAQPSAPKGKVPVPQMHIIEKHARAVTFLDADLLSLGVSRTELGPFVLREEDRSRLVTEVTGDSSLERRPLVDCGDRLTTHCRESRHSSVYPDRTASNRSPELLRQRPRDHPSPAGCKRSFEADQTRCCLIATSGFWRRGDAVPPWLASAL